jgi:hypothetical protein
MTMTWADVSTHSIAFLAGAFTGAAGKYLADKFTDQRHRQESRAAAEATFQRVQRAMPALIADIKADLAVHPYVRELAVLPTETTGYNSDHTVFCYSDEQHPNIVGHVVLLEAAGFVEDHSTPTNPVFRMSEDFVERTKRS